MTEKERLSAYVDEGFKPMMILRDVSQEEFDARGLPEAFRGRIVKALPLWHSDNRKLMFYMVDDATIEYAQQLVAGAQKVIGYSPRALVSAIGVDAIGGSLISLDEVASALHRMKGWNTSVSPYPNTLQINEVIDSGDESKLAAFQHDVESVCQALSLKNKHGFVVSIFSSGERYEGQPFATLFGFKVCPATPITLEDLSGMEELRSQPACETGLDALRLIYSQVSDSSKIVTAWSAVEQLFDELPVHILTDYELDEVIVAIKKIPTLENQNDKLEKIESVLKDKNFMATQNRNRRVATAIARLMKISFENANLEVQKVTRTRGKMAHSHKIENSSECIQFIEKVLCAYIDRERMK